MFVIARPRSGRSNLKIVSDASGNLTITKIKDQIA